MDAVLQDSITFELTALNDPLRKLLEPVAAACPSVWDSTAKLDGLLRTYLLQMDHCKLLYALDCDGIQRSANISPTGVETCKRGQDLSVRPYMKQMDTGQQFMLSAVYMDAIDRRPCITAMHQLVKPDGKILGCIAADFDLQDLPSMRTGISKYSDQWRQIKGDPVIRQNLFKQKRATSAMDEQQDMVNSIVTDLMLHRGVFHAKLHYSSSRATIWVYNDPHRYRLHVLDEITDPAVCLAYPVTPYPSDAVVSPEDIYPVFSRFKELRNADHTIYLRSGSLNIINSMVGLTFSCDGSHYLSVREFMNQDNPFQARGG